MIDCHNDIPARSFHAQLFDPRLTRILGGNERGMQCQTAPPRQLGTKVTEIDGGLQLKFISMIFIRPRARILL